MKPLLRCRWFWLLVAMMLPVIWYATPFQRGMAMAYIDQTLGRYYILSAGKQAPWIAGYDRLLFERYGVRRHNLGPMETERLSAYMDGYNAVTRRRLFEKYGRDVFLECSTVAWDDFRRELCGVLGRESEEVGGAALALANTWLNHGRPGFAFAAYVGSYLGLVDRESFPPFYISGKYVRIPAAYRFGGDLSKAIFAPINEVDRRTRPDHWVRRPNLYLFSISTLNSATKMPQLYQGGRPLDAKEMKEWDDRFRALRASVKEPSVDAVRRTQP